MHTRGQSLLVGVSWRTQAVRVALIFLLLAVAIGCASAPATTEPKVTACGTAKTAANVPIHIEVTSGHVTCTTALAIERKYAEAIRSGLAPGNGGGGPVKVNGWTCQGYATPVVLHTGKTSKCVKDGTEILAILPTTA
ncbi:MAG TPA: hypothetical protein VN695_10060 [Streptosporangiaceae bacterium]|nr:hypothetical protein [Streptosporangiaceae bacterium]